MGDSIRLMLTLTSWMVRVQVSGLIVSFESVGHSASIASAALAGMASALTEPMDPMQSAVAHAMHRRRRPDEPA